MSAKENNPITNFSEEYAYFLKNHLLRLFGVSCNNILPYRGNATNSNGRNVYLEDEHVVFSVFQKPYFIIPASSIPYIESDSFALASKIVDAFLDYSEYKAKDETQRRFKYRSKSARNSAYKSAIQDGIALWIFGSTDAETLGEFFELLEKWSVKTYEGKHVTLGFLVNPSSRAKPILSFKELLSFLDDDSSAVLSDCIHSVLELDKKCNLLGYHSITESHNLSGCKQNENVPIRFVQAVQKFLPEKASEAGSDKVGVFLLSNGDILLIKNGITRFVKRNLQWLNLSRPAFENSLSAGGMCTHIKQDILQSVYASVLDVSFSHTGGIIAIIDSSYIEGLMVDKILSPFDNLQITDEVAEKYAKQTPLDEKIIRRKLLKNLILEKSFRELDRKLRCELIALDGACIISSKDGTVFSFGAIIQNESGSATGGRSAAAKALSQYGAAIKISTDGYIDVFVKGDLVYSIK